MLAWVIGGVLGAFVGSFLGVVIHRLPQGQSIVRPPSHCDDCGTVLRWYDNVPIIGWLLLRGRCRWCGARIPWSVWAIEVVTAVVTGAVCWWAVHEPTAVGGPLAWSLAGWTSWPWLAAGLAAMALLVAVWALLVSTLTDLIHLIIPDELSKPLQLTAPFLCLMTIGPEADDSVFPWFWRLFVWNVTGGMWLISMVMVVIGSMLLLLVSLPFARWVYSTRIRGPFPWSEDDHQAFAKGLYWYVISLVPALLVMVLLGATLTVEDAQAGSLGSLVVLWLSYSLLGSLLGWCLPYAVGLLGSWAFARNAMGYGDVKMLAWMGAFLGPVGVLYTFFLAAIYGSAVGIPMRLLGGGREIPFGPYLVAGAITAFVFAGSISGWVLGTMQAGG